jgi:uncharacterized repeat protein (TIGR01451 family)
MKNKICNLFISSIIFLIAHNIIIGQGIYALVGNGLTGTASNSFYFWNGSSWVLKSNTSGSSYSKTHAMGYDGTNLIVTSGSTTYSASKKYNGTAWSTFGSSYIYNGVYNSIATNGTTMYSLRNGLYTNFYLKTSTTWSVKTSPTTTDPNTPMAIGYHGATLYALIGGSKFMSFNGTTWTDLSANAPNTGSTTLRRIAMTTHNGTLYSLVARDGGYTFWSFNGTSWTSLTAPTSTFRSDVSIMSDGTDIYALMGNGTSTEFIKWDGTTWVSLTPPTTTMGASVAISLGPLAICNGTSASGTATSPTYMVGTKNATYAFFNSSGDNVVIDLGTTTIPIGNVVTIHRNASIAGSVKIETSEDGSTYHDEGTIPLPLNNVASSFNHTLLNNTRYLKLTWVSGTFGLDAVDFVCPTPVPPCSVPVVTVSVVPPTCIGNTPQNNGIISLSGMDASARRVDFTIGNTYSGAGFNSAQIISGTNYVVTNTLPSPTATQEYTVRIFCNATTYYDKVITLVPNNCLGYFYNIDGGPFQVSNIFNCILPGDHILRVKDDKGCLSAPTTVNVPVAPGSETVTGTITNPTCADPNIGVITITAPLGANYTYSINGIEYVTSPIFTDLEAGTYTITVRNNTNGCVTPKSFTLSPSGQTTPTFTVTDPSCSVGSSTITITSPLPSTGVTYSLYNWATNLPTDPQTSNIFVVNYDETNSFDFTVIVDENGCSVQNYAHILLKPQPKTPLTPTAIPVHPTCTVNTGSITVSLNSLEQIAPSSILYSIDGTNFQESNIFNNLAPGTYQIYLKNRIDLCISASITITINPIPDVPFVPLANPTQPDCGDPTGTITISSPIGPDLLYSIDGVSYTNTDGIFTGLTAGTYTVTVKNNISGCISNFTSVIINSPPVFPIVPTATPTQLTCTIDKGSITVTSPLGSQYEYNLGSGFQAGVTFIDLEPGTYNVQVKEIGNECISTSADIIILPQPITPFKPAANITQPTCSVGTGTITVSDPLGADLRYSIDGVDYSNVTGIFGGLNPGNYNVTVRNIINGCTSTSLTVIINPQPIKPATPVIQISQPVCPRTTGVITVLSPKEPGLIYNIDGTMFFSSNMTGVFDEVIGGTYTINVNSPTGSCASDHTTATIMTPNCAGFDLALRKILHPNSKSVVAPGEPVFFLITVINQGNVTATNIQVTDYIPAGLILNDPNWTTPVGGKTSMVTPIPSLDPGMPFQILINFTAGTFNGVVTNFAEISSADGGIDIDSYPDADPNNDGSVQDNVITGVRKSVMTDDEDDHDPANVTISNSNLSCNLGVTCSSTPQSDCTPANGTASASITGAQGIITYIWNSGETTSGITGKAAGIYSVTVTDDIISGCTAICQVVITSTITLPTAMCTPIANSNCSSPNGSVSVSTNATNPTYLWSNNATTLMISNLAANTYTVTVTDGVTGCTNSTQATITNPVIPTCSITATSQPTCASLTGGAASAVGNGGQVPYSFAWSNGATGPTASGLTGGTYTVTVTDAGDCTSTCQVILNTPMNCCNINAIVPQNIECLDNSTPSKITDNRIRFSAQVTNTNASLTGYNVTINGGTTITPNTNVAYGVTQFTLGIGTAGSGTTYTITVTDSATPGCTQTFQVTDPGNCTPATPECPQVKCGTATIQVNGN